MTAAHPDATAFLAAICAAPADDAPRLVFADWLTENGEPERAAFIEVQIELAKPEPECAGPAFTGRGVLPCPEWNARHPSRDNWCGVCAARRDLRARERQLWNSTDAAGDWLICPGKPFGNAHYLLPTDAMATAGALASLPVFVFRRGFVHSARLTCAAFLGGPCAVCAGAGRRWSNGAPVGVNCSGCHGSGRTPGLAATLAIHPVTAVVLTDREPHATYIEASGERCWAWWKAGNGPAASQLPPELWNILVPPFALYPVEWDEITVFNRPSLEAAHAALGAAAVAYLRRQGE